MISFDDQHFWVFFTYDYVSQKFMSKEGLLGVVYDMAITLHIQVAISGQDNQQTLSKLPRRTCK